MKNKIIISTKNITKSFGRRKILDNINIDIAEQSLVSIIGPNGAGKSTLVKIILGLDNDYTGTVVIRPNERVQYIPQLSMADQHQLPMSVYEYMAIATSRIYSLSSKKVNFEKALEHVNVPVEKLHQLYTTLSGGERQRVAIARALLSVPTILVLDEPLAAVDHASRLGLYELIRHLQQDHKMTVLLISHDIESVLPLSDQVVCLNTTLNTNCHLSEESIKNNQGNKLVNHNC